MSFELILPFFPQSLQNLIMDTTVADLCINGTEGVFVERNGVMARAEAVSIGEEQLSAAIQQIARVLGKDITEQDPILDTRLPNGSRVAALYKPCSPNGVTVTIRKFNRWFTTAELTAMGSLPESVCDTVIAAILNRRNVLISGGTGSGKSTLIRIILYQVEERGDSAIVYDPHREYLTEFYNAARGDIILNPTDERCPYWPIGEEADDEAQALPIARGLFPDRPNSQPFFIDHTRAIFAYLLAYYRPTVNQLGHWMAHPEEIDKRVANTEHAHTLTVNAPPQRAGILGTLNEAGTSLRMMPSHPEGRQRFTARDWSRKRQSWIFVTSTSETIDALRPLQGLWLDLCILKLLGEADPDAKRCWLVLDEVQKLAQLPQLPRALTEQRKSGNPIVIGFQGMAQIDAHYGKEAETMLSQPFTTFILRSKEPRASEYLSNLIGKVQIKRFRETKPATVLAGGRYRSYNTERVIEPLVLGSEIQSLPDLHGYCLQGGKVVKIAFRVPPMRKVAPGIIERLIPGAPKRPLDPEPETQALKPL